MQQCELSTCRFVYECHKLTATIGALAQQAMVPLDILGNKSYQVCLLLKNISIFIFSLPHMPILILPSVVMAFPACRLHQL